MDKTFRLGVYLDEEWVEEIMDEGRYPISNIINGLEYVFEYFSTERENAFNFTAFLEYEDEEKAKELILNIIDDMGARENLIEMNLELIENGERIERDSVAKLVGAQGFKDFIEEMTAVAKELCKHELEEVFIKRCLLYSIGDGCGLTTQLTILEKQLRRLKLIKERFTVEECKIKTTTESIQGGEFNPYTDFLGDIRYGSNTIKCIDISNQMHLIQTVEFRNFLRNLSKEIDKYYFIFRIPFVDEETRARIKTVLGDVFSVREVVINPYTIEDFKSYAKILFDAKGMTLEEKAWKVFEEKIILEKQDSYFYNFATIQKIVEEILYKKHLVLAIQGGDSICITCEDMEGSSVIHREEISAIEQLDQLIGMKEVKERILELVDQLEFSVKHEGMINPCLHMQFVGNPGTGKTTIARILGKLLQERNLLSVGGFFEHFARDLCGRYIGETAPKTSAICRDAYGSVLFIDEAYSLFRQADDQKDFGVEAIDTLIAQMENHRRDLVVILAGYKEDMEKMIESNTGLASRIPHVVYFPNYTREDLTQIFLTMVDKHFNYDADFEKAVENYFYSITDEVLESKEFSNARFVRNLFERTWGKAATRIRLEGTSEMNLVVADFNRAVAEREFDQLQQKHGKKIGF